MLAINSVASMSIANAEPAFARLEFDQTRVVSPSNHLCPLLALLPLCSLLHTFSFHSIPESFPVSQLFAR